MLHIPETGFISKLIFLIVTFLQEPLGTGNEPPPVLIDCLIPQST